MAVLRVIPAGDIQIVNGKTIAISGAPAIRQKISTRFRFFLGEWFLDTRQGVPYYRDVFLKDPSLDVIRSTFRKLVLGTPGVLSLASFAINYDQSARTLSFAFQAKVNGGDAVVQPTDRDFLIGVAT